MKLFKRAYLLTVLLSAVGANVFAHDIDPRQVINDAIALSICQADVQKR